MKAKKTKKRKNKTTEEKMVTEIYTVEQIFETLGDPCKKEFSELGKAVEYAEALRQGIFDWVMTMDIPRNSIPQCGYSEEIAAWEEAEEMSGIERDECGYLTEDSPQEFSESAAEYIAETAVFIFGRTTEITE